MHPIDHYYTIRRGQEELLRQAEHERMIRAARRKQWPQQGLHQKFANWLGTHMVNWGQKLEQFGAPGRLQTYRELPKSIDL